MTWWIRPSNHRGKTAGPWSTMSISTQEVALKERQDVLMPKGNGWSFMRTQLWSILQSISLQRNLIHDRLVYTANIYKSASVVRIIRRALPENAKVSEDFQVCMQECVNEFISFITSEGAYTLTLYNLHYAWSLTLNWWSRGEMSAGKTENIER